MNFQRLLRADAVAMIAALALLLVMALDWYSTTVGERAREIQKLSQPNNGGVGGEAERLRREDAKFAAQAEEKNAWQASGTIDRLILIALLGTVVLAVASAWLRAAGRRFEPPFTPSAAVALMATATGLLVAYRIIQQPGDDAFTTVKAGAPLALVVLGVIALAARQAMRQELDGTAWAEAGPSAARPVWRSGPSGSALGPDAEAGDPKPGGRAGPPEE